MNRKLMLMAVAMACLVGCEPEQKNISVPRRTFELMLGQGADTNLTARIDAIGAGLRLEVLQESNNWVAVARILDGMHHRLVLLETRTNTYSTNQSGPQVKPEAKAVPLEATPGINIPRNIEKP